MPTFQPTANAWVAAMLAAACLASFAMSLASPASSEPAVSGINGKVTAFGGAHGDGRDDDGVGGLAGSFTLPLGIQFGAQIDGAWARVGEEDFGDTGVHLFWRDPKVGLLGVYGGYANLTDDDGQELGRVGIEAQYFAGQITLDLASGYRFGDVDDSPYVRAKIDYYALENLKVSAGYIYEEESFALASAEYQFSSNHDAGASLFAEGRVNDEDRYTVLAGIKIYIGEQMVLIDRHRRQDPDGYVDLDLIGTSQPVNDRRNRSQPGGGGTSCPFVPSSSCISLQIQCSTAVPSLTSAQISACGCPSGC